MSLKPGSNKVIFLFLFWFTNMARSSAQDQTTDSLKNVLSTLPDSRQKVQVLLEISQTYLNTSLKDAFDYTTHARDIASQVKDDEGLADSYRRLGIIFKRQGRSSEALDAYAASLQIFKKKKDLIGQSIILNNLGSLFEDQAVQGSLSGLGQLSNMAKGQETKALEYYFQALKLGEQAKDNRRIVTTLNNMNCVKNQIYFLAKRTFVVGLVLCSPGCNCKCLF